MKIKNVITSIDICVNRYILILWKPKHWENIWSWDTKHHMIDTPLISFWW